ncbi:putative membrane lipoprotein lipid attachment site-like protein [Thalictrum thalictroides]|uniref:Putative membrane lipoprotein lipid attachment site-like protein n=1 Tax=Thalictrum thalictroides TaxID=46969 RepID=A0A7J6XAS2_THATH|nr:putative membrane lipoprotein lipid attachment site-like protein [Thalictrum thalictroides]
MAPRLFSCFGRGGSSHHNAYRSHGFAESASATADQLTEEQNRGGAILVELFSSQGCKTSLEAELLLSRLGRGDFELDVPVIVLAFHVDYWDYMGWKDPYGSSLWTVRQKGYVEALNLDTMFTPQVVVQGRIQCVGTDEDALLSHIRSAARFPAPGLQATFQKPSEDSLQVSLTGPLRIKIDGQGVDIMVVLYENGLVNDCPKGENKGRVLTNDFVVRKYEKLCTVKDISAKKTISGTITFKLWEGFNSSKCGVAVFVQNSSFHTFGSQNFPLADNLL